MNSTYKLTRFLGSPFAGEEVPLVEIGPSEKESLYDLAYKNKIGLYFLEKLHETGNLSPLEDLYERDLNRYRETHNTAIRLSSKISEVTDAFAIFKFIKPYPHTPSDVDVLFFLPKTDFQRVVDYLTNNGYFQIGECPSQIVVYDLTGGYENLDRRLVGGKAGGKYYIDLYNNVSASHVVYINKEQLSELRTKYLWEGKELQILHPAAETLIILTHSIIPEQLFTLGDFYTALYAIHGMTNEELQQLSRLFIDNHIAKAGFASLNIISHLHEEIFGFVPGRIDDLMQNLGLEKGMEAPREIEMPYRYPLSVLTAVLLERMKNPTGFQSIMHQAVCMCNPRLLKWVMYNIVLRRTRETY